ncbi:MAG: NAD-dependent epimerase [Candidatus Marinimicrobia bacterium]|nr:NAD-dependent epimerase [Candidatus Neomarinimicrobiota bacterium]|tara:strand:+ start:417 stop:1439 length:1023 start_codon:yes stop_codon:yes gene_type:complete
MKKVLITGSEGFIGGYIVKELLNQGYFVYGIDNLSKYGEVIRNHSDNENYKFFNNDVKDRALLKEIMSDCDYLIAGAAMIGGISYFHEFEYDLLSENEKIISATTDVAIDCFKNSKLKRVVFLSSSMVFESSDIFPTKEEDLFKIPPPISSYGFQKLAVEYFARSAFSQYGLEFSIARPFNCVGIGEVKTKTEKKLTESSSKLALSHVVPDLILKTLQGTDSIEILGSGNQIRHYTYGEDLAKGICLLLEHPNAKNEDFNLSTAQSTTVLELAEIIWEKIRKDEEFKYTSVDPFEFDVQKRIPSTDKAKKLLGFEATTTIDEMLDIVIPWIEKAKEENLF